MMLRFLKLRRGWDVIGDIHGHAEKLTQLLHALGYRKSGSVWAHPQRKALFLGDYINRGPDIRRCVDMVRGMVEHGHATALIGNHEHNALLMEAHGADALPAKYARQLSGTVEAYAGHRRAYTAALEFFMRLPLLHDGGGIRAVHACWSPQAIQALGWGKTLRNSDLDGRETPRTRAIALLLNGPSLPGPDGKDSFRIQWWRGDRPSWRQAGYPERSDFPDTSLPATARSSFVPYAANEKPLFFGHYGFAKPSRPLTGNLCCLDLAVARGGRMAAYQWRGEQGLTRENFVTC